MQHKCVVVADRARARFFTLQAAPVPERGPRLQEEQDLVNPEGELTGEQLFRNEKSGPGRSPGGGPTHNFDDHREEHLTEIGRRFARQVAVAAVQFAQRNAAQTVVLVAEPHFLGLLRPELEGQWPNEVARTELAGELSWHSSAHIQDVLTQKGLLPEKQAS